MPCGPARGVRRDGFAGRDAYAGDPAARAMAYSAGMDADTGGRSSQCASTTARLRIAVGLAALAAAGVAIALWAPGWLGGERPAPEARWRNGVIVAIRHCEDPADEATYVRCASLHCAQRVTELLTNAQQAKLTISGHARVGDRIRVTGDIEQYLRARTLPTGFECDMRGMLDAQPRMLFARRHVEEDEFKARTERGSMEALRDADLFTPRGGREPRVIRHTVAP